VSYWLDTPSVSFGISPGNLKCSPIYPLQLVLPSFVYPSLTFCPPSEHLLSATASPYDPTQSALASSSGLSFPTAHTELGAHLTGDRPPRTFHFQGLSTLLAVCFSQNLWPISQSQALVGFSLQSLSPPKGLVFSQSHSSLVVDQCILRGKKPPSFH
jgi:hypothetical protein